MAIKQSVMDIGGLIEIEVESLSYSDHAVGRIGGLVVFISGGVPGDKLLVRITQIKKNYAIAEAVEVLSASSHRCQPPCVHFTEGCGGCQWQHITYEHQLHWKKEIVKQALRRIGKLESIPEIETHEMCPSLHYRNKLRLFPTGDSGMSGAFALGMRRVGSHEVVPIKECLISTHIVNSLSPMFRGEIFSTGDRLNEVNIRSSDKYQQIMVSCTYNRDGHKIATDIDRLSHTPGIISIFYRIASRKFILGYGEPNIMEEVCGIEYKIDPYCFFQINIAGLEVLIDLVKEFAGGDNHFILDAHCGVGTFALQMADLSDAVWGIDVSSPAITLAQSNAADNGVTNVYCRKGTIADVMETFANESRDISIDLAILDPPRRGCEKADLKALIHSQPGKVIYISCNPTTLARDLHDLSKAGYRLQRLAMVDMFPMTYHLEVVAFCVK